MHANQAACDQRGSVWAKLLPGFGHDLPPPPCCMQHCTLQETAVDVKVHGKLSRVLCILVLQMVVCFRWKENVPL